MPELPEVEVIARTLFKNTQSKIIRKFILNNRKLRYELPNILETIKDLKITNIFRRAKYLVIETDKGFVLIHLGMTGKLLITTKNQELNKHDHVEIILDDFDIRFNDVRRFGLLDFYKTKIDLLNSRYFKLLGIEPLSEDFTPDYLLSCLDKKSKIKQVLMDSRVVVGVGNIYASEILYKSHVLPTRAANTITFKEAELIVSETRRILLSSIDRGGTTIRDFKNSNGKVGEFVKCLQVYGRAGQNCSICGRKIEQISISGRSSYYCSGCQH